MDLVSQNFDYNTEEVNRSIRDCLSLNTWGKMEPKEANIIDLFINCYAKKNWNKLTHHFQEKKQQEKKDWK